MYKKCTSNYSLASYVYHIAIQKMCKLYKTCELQSSDLKLEMYVFCTYKQCTNYTKPIQRAN